MRRILFFMPDNPLKKNAGNRTRALSMLSYFKSRNFEIDFVSEYFTGRWNETDIKTFKQADLANNTYVIKKKPSKKNILYYLLFYKLPNFFYQNRLWFFPLQFPELVTLRFKRAFNRILKNNHYDYIFINYASWASVIENNPLTKKSVKVIDMHDFITAQLQKKVNIGQSFNEEIRRISLFDIALAISVEEQYVFSQFCKNRVVLAPMMLDRPENFHAVKEKSFDLIYVASDNIHNQKAANWFFNNVYPLLPTGIQICVIGQINEHLSIKGPNLITINFAEDLSTYYQNAKIALCPMLTGTGTKIKVVEALSYGLPIVCNTRGIDGLINKTNNGCLVSDDPVEFANNIMKLLTDESEYKKQAESALAAFSINYEREHCYKNLDKLFLK
ncbi:glycosyltransferase involved in cell wall biosynthesis [Pedobacter sp. W3I1]|uniref:glycosyltransferase n=1 Tax=Pedobacter sp. W3I1 TaxID=3042291 RepID=UPI00278A52AC|nr:glycosyltransferase family 4 protein [Pedobacter sp. W3I1]MDQ0641804.1 glycosyltransferase involved in cell wall biosynthesis [Pedobacter sp. W3I1]